MKYYSDAVRAGFYRAKVQSVVNMGGMKFYTVDMIPTQAGVRQGFTQETVMMSKRVKR